jgi:O-antigen/teichoic acid export membrane protein
VSGISADSIPAGKPTEPASLGSHAMRGAFWNVLFSVLNKVTTFGGQIVLAWYLVPADMGLIALATSVSAMLSVISVASLADTILQEKDEAKFLRDFGQIFWICNSINIGLAALCMLAAPWIGRAYHQPALTPVLILIEVNAVFVGLSLVYGTALKRSLHFKKLAIIFFISGTIQSVVSVVMAWKGCGAYSIIVPLALSSLIGLVLQFWAAGPIPVGRPQPRLWPGYLAPSFWLLFMTILPALQTQGTSFVMGFSQNTEQIGLFFWGYSLANQVVFLICNNLRTVLFPTLARLNHEPVRQAEAIRKSTSLMMTVLAYFCVLQAVTARPLIGLIFPQRWQGAVGVVGWISLGMLTQPLSILCFSLLMAQAKYRQVVQNAAVQGALVVACAALGCLLPGADAERAGAWTALGFLLGGLYSGWQMLAPLGRPWASLAGLLTKPLLMAAGCGLCGVLAVQAVAGRGLALQVALGGLAVTLAYAAAIRLFDMASYRELRSRF